MDEIWTRYGRDMDEIGSIGRDMDGSMGREMSM